VLRWCVRAPSWLAGWLAGALWAGVWKGARWGAAGYTRRPASHRPPLAAAARQAPPSGPHYCCRGLLQAPRPAPDPRPAPLPACQALPNGNYRVGVHIADVAHFVRPGTPLDEEAALRGTSVYLVQKVGAAGAGGRRSGCTARPALQPRASATPGLSPAAGAHLAGSSCCLGLLSGPSGRAG
jgi:hypothetical protein